jgi:hypothetical protein
MGRTQLKLTPEEPQFFSKESKPVPKILFQKKKKNHTTLLIAT